ncbi:MAG: hypothetical protein J6C87_02580 [Bacteroides sp.]|nr:hypothetical protein [Bacteroides sp.]
MKTINTYNGRGGVRPPEHIHVTANKGRQTLPLRWMTLCTLFSVLCTLSLALYSCESESIEPSPSNSLHIASVTIDGRSPATRVAYEETASHTYPYNRTITGFEVGDKLNMEYNFKGGFDGSNGLSACFVKTTTGWDVQDKNGTSITIRPAEGEKWEDLYIGFVNMSDGDVSDDDENYAAIAEAMGVVQGDVPQANSIIESDQLSASADAENIAAGDGIVTVDTDINSPTLGAMTVNLKHRYALLRLPVAGVTVAQGTYFVDDKEYTNPTLATLWAVVNDGSTISYSPLTKVTINSTGYLQAIVWADSTYKLTGFKAVMQCGTGESAVTFTLDLPFTSGTDTSAGTGLTLKPGTRHPLTLSISPSTTPSP